MCGGDSVRSAEPASDDADLLYRIVHAEARRHAVYANFDRYRAGFDDGDRNAA